MRKYIFALLIIVGTTFLIGSSTTLWCAEPIKAELSFDKAYYEYGEPVGATVTVKNDSGGPLYISKGFSTKDFYLEIRVIDPAGRLVLAKRTAPHDEFPDAPPLPFCQKNDATFTQVAAYEILSADWSSTSVIEDLRDYYPFKFPGSYSFQIQLSAMTWNPPQGDPCPGDINASHASVGLFKSETNYIYTAGSTEIDVYPEWWLFHIIELTGSDMTTVEFANRVRDWFTTAKHPRFDRP